MQRSLLFFYPAVSRCFLPSSALPLPGNRHAHMHMISRSFGDCYSTPLTNIAVQVYNFLGIIAIFYSQMPAEIRENSQTGPYFCRYIMKRKWL